MPMNYGEAKFTENCGSPSIECFVNPVSMFFFYQKKKKGEKDEEKKKKEKENEEKECLQTTLLWRAIWA